MICPAALAWGAQGSGKEADMTLLHLVGALVKQNGKEVGRERTQARELSVTLTFPSCLQRSQWDSCSPTLQKKKILQNFNSRM